MQNKIVFIVCMCVNFIYKKSNFYTRKSFRIQIYQNHTHLSKYLKI